MNIKTTLGLGFAVILLSVAYLVFGIDRGGQSPDSGDGGIAIDGGASGGEAQQADSRSLTQPPLTDESEIVKVSYQPRGKAALVFERTAGENVSNSEKWRMVEPTPCPAATWTVNDIALAAKRLKYASKYTVGGAGGLSLEQAGLRPEPVARFVLTSESGETVTFEVGDLLVSQRKRYVYLPSKPDDIYVAEEDFGNILDRDLTQFRERNMFRITTADAVELEIKARGDEGVVTYKLKKQDGKWVFVAPFSAPAEQKKIKGLVNSMNQLFATGWLEKAPSSLAEFGLEEPLVSVKVITEEIIETPKPADDETEPAEEGEKSGEEDAEESDDEEAEESEPVIKREEFVLLLSEYKPIDDDKKVYAKRGRDEQVGLVNATELDKFVPRLNEWRKMKVLEVSAAEADSLKIRTSAGTVEFELRGNDWYFAGTEEMAEPVEVAGLLASLELLKAVSFVDSGSQPEFGLDQPAAEVTLGFPESEKVETLKIGGFTETIEKRLRYVQRVGSSAVAKVKSKGVQDVFRDKKIYRDRELLNYAQSRLLKIELTRRLAESGRQQSLTLSRDENKVWQMTLPVEAEVDLGPVNEMVKKLAKLRGMSIVEEVNPDKLGLADPDIQVTVTIEGVPTIKVEDSTEDTVPVPGEPVIRQIALSRRDGRVYAHRVDQTVFMEVESAAYDALLAEVLDGVFWDISQSQVVAFGSKDEQREVSFRKVQDRWQYSLEPDFPIDSEKVTQHLSRIINIKTPRYVEYDVSSLADYGLDAPTHRFFFELDDGKRFQSITSLSISRVARIGGDSGDLRQSGSASPVADGRQREIGRRDYYKKDVTWDVLCRSIYLPMARSVLPDMLATFDAADPNLVVGAR
ncbi:MAG: DUF4340 domain-containing protein, partial [Planctomycetes bacterium]|nr:DUF4340 domain-containing protein [Planctomycetota bacterium]